MTDRTVSLDRARYAALYGPTVGDRIRLADTDLLIRVEADLCGGPGLAGDEAVFGGGKVIRESMGQSGRTSAERTPDLVITGAIVLDHWGIVKADVGVRDGRIVALGKAGNPDTMDGVHPDLVIGPSTEILAGNGKILTAGAIDSHVHLICPQIMDTALASGITTIIGGGTGPAEGTKGTTCTPGAWNIGRMLQAADGLPSALKKVSRASPPPGSITASWSKPTPRWRSAIARASAGVICTLRARASTTTKSLPSPCIFRKGRPEAWGAFMARI